MCVGTVLYDLSTSAYVTLVSEIPRQVVVFKEMSKFLHMAKYDVLQAQASFMKLKVLKTCHKIVTEFSSDSKAVVHNYRQINMKLT